MTELTVARAVIDPEDLRGTTLPVERVEKPGHPLVAVVEEPLVFVGRRKVSIIRELPDREGYVVSWEAILSGGVDKGLRFKGMWAELKLRYSPLERIVEPTIPGGSITEFDNKSYWGS